MDYSHPVAPLITALAQRRAQGVFGDASKGVSAHEDLSAASVNHFDIGRLKPDLRRFTTDSGKGFSGDRASIALPAPSTKADTNSPKVSSSVASTNGVRSSRECPML